VTVEQVLGRPAIAELGDRLATADGPHEMLTQLEEELMRRLCETVGLGLVRHTSSVIAATSGAVAIGDLSVAAGVSSTHLAQRFKPALPSPLLNSETGWPRRFLREHPGHALDGWPLPAD
jgi:hypothetical protein